MVYMTLTYRAGPSDSNTYKYHQISTQLWRSHHRSDKDFIGTPQLEKSLKTLQLMEFFFQTLSRIMTND